MRNKISIILAGAIITTSFAVIATTVSDSVPPQEFAAQLAIPGAPPPPPVDAEDDYMPPYEPNEVIVVFQDDQGGIGQQVDGNTYQSNSTVESQIENRLQAIIPDEDLEIESQVLFNANLVDPSTRREAKVEKMREQGLNRANALGDSRLVFAQAKSRTRSTEELIALFAQDAEVKYVQPNYIYNLPNTLLDPVNTVNAMNNENAAVLWNIYNNQSGAGMDADKVWNDYNLTGQGIIVAALDTGVDIDHPDLKTNIWRNFGESNCSDGIDNDNNDYVDDCFGWDFGEKDNDVKGQIFHGTHTAGIIAAKKDGSGVVGVAPDSRLMALKVFRDDGAARTSDVVAAIDYAWRNNADVISLSLGRKDDCSSIEEQAISRALQAGVFVITSSGNADPDNGLTIPFSNAPAVCSGAFTIGATDQTKQRADYSNYFASMVKALAPGGKRSDGILSTIQDGKFGTSSGTSMAVPHISGLVALLYQANASLLPDDISDILCASAVDAGDLGEDSEYGCGVINAVNAVDTLIGQNDPNTNLELPAPPPVPPQMPLISNARWQPASVPSSSKQSTLSFSVCDRNNDLLGGAIDIVHTGASSSFVGGPLSWSSNPPNRDVSDCENPYSYEIPVNLSSLTNGQHCADVSATDGLGQRSNVIGNVCVTITDSGSGGVDTLSLSPKFQIKTRGVTPQLINVSGGQNYTYTLDAGTTGIAKTNCNSGFTTCQLSAPSGVGTATLRVTDINGKTATAKVFVNGSNNGNLSVQKTSSASSVQPGGTLSYTINYSNNTANIYSALILKDDYDETKIRIVAPPDGCTDNGDVLTCALNGLNAGQSGTITYQATAR